MEGATCSNIGIEISGAPKAGISNREKMVMQSIRLKSNANTNAIVAEDISFAQNV